MEYRSGARPAGEVEQGEDGEGCEDEEGYVAKGERRNGEFFVIWFGIGVVWIWEDESELEGSGAGGQADR